MLYPIPAPPESAPRVVVTGAGIVTALGRGWEPNARGFRDGTVAIGPVTLFDVSGQRVKVAGEVTSSLEVPGTRLSSRQLPRLDRAARLLLIAAIEAWQQAGWSPGARLPLVLATTSGGMNLGQDFYREAIKSVRSNRKQAVRITHYQAQRQALDLFDALGFSGPATIIANACASGGNAIGHAWELIRRGQADRALAGGYDAQVGS